MFNLETVLSVFNEKGTLLKWLKSVESALKGDTLKDVQVVQLTETTAQLKFLFNDGTELTSSELTLARGATGPAGPAGPAGAQGPAGPKGDTGAAGAPGLIGAVGPQGPRGPEGPAGAQGPQGIQGPQGVPGASGKSYTVSGQVNTPEELPVASAILLGQAYFVGATAPREVYACVEADGTIKWENQGALQGPEGPAGVQGPQGIQGVPGPEGPVGAEGRAGNGVVGITTVSHSVVGNETVTNIVVHTDEEDMPFEVHAENGKTPLLNVVKETSNLGLSILVPPSITTVSEFLSYLNNNKNRALIAFGDFVNEEGDQAAASYLFASTRITIVGGNNTIGHLEPSDFENYFIVEEY